MKLLGDKMRNYGSAHLAELDAMCKEIPGLEDAPVKTAVQPDEPLLTGRHFSACHPFELAQMGAIDALTRITMGEAAAELLNIRWSQAIGRRQRDVADGRRTAVEGLLRTKELWQSDIIQPRFVSEDDTLYIFKAIAAGRLENTALVVVHKEEHDMEGFIDPLSHEKKVGIDHSFIAARANATCEELQASELAVSDYTIETITALQTAARQRGLV